MQAKHRANGSGMPRWLNKELMQYLVILYDIQSQIETHPFSQRKA